MDLFSGHKTCDYCGTVPRSKNPVLFGGFRDQDTSQLVCWNCRVQHYRSKSAGEKSGLYSEMPELIT